MGGPAGSSRAPPFPHSTLAEAVSLRGFRKWGRARSQSLAAAAAPVSGARGTTWGGSEAGGAGGEALLCATAVPGPALAPDLPARQAPSVPLMRAGVLLEINGLGTSLSWGRVPQVLIRAGTASRRNHPPTHPPQSQDPHLGSRPRVGVLHLVDVGFKLVDLQLEEEHERAGRAVGPTGQRACSVSSPRRPPYSLRVPVSRSFHLHEGNQARKPQDPSLSEPERRTPLSSRKTQESPGQGPPPLPS